MISKATFSVSTLVIRLLAVVLFVGYFAARYDMYLTVAHMPHPPKMSATASLIGVVCNPIYFYCLGLWVLGGVFGRLKRGEAFTPALLSNLKRMAACLIAGGVFGTLVFPLITALTTQANFREHVGFWSRFGFHGIDLTIGLLGVVLLAVSRQGQRLRGELDQFV